ncbi:MAG TPA: DUF6483 family protein [Bacteroidota bacterium]|nr:DUF6483 family protein [Bacteroidota bacterium]
MIEQDYFMRMISELGRVLSRISFLKGQKDFPRAVLEIQTSGRTLLGIDHTIISSLSASQLRTLLGTDPALAVPRAYILGLLIEEEADIRSLMGEDSDAMRVKSLELLLDAWLDEEKPLGEDHTARIDALLERLADFAPGAELLEKVMAFQERNGRYDRAENALYDILAAKPEFAPDALRFYRRLLLKSDAELAAGNLPREEVLEGMAGVKIR